MSDDGALYQETLLWSVVALCAAKKKLLRKKRRALWCKKWLSRRPQKGSFNEIFLELQVENPEDFKNYTRMPVDALYSLLAKIEPLISKQNTSFRDSISPGARLEATLLYLASGVSYSRLQYSTRISKQSLGLIIPETCEAIYNVLREDYLKIPSTPGEWKAVAKQFERWNFPHCVGAVDGKHIAIWPPKESGSYYYNYKGSHSIVLMAAVNANYEFMYVDVGTNGRISDGGVWANSTLCARLQDGAMGLPADEQLSDSHRTLPYVFVGDDAFPLKRYFMKPYPYKHQNNEQRIFSYRLSRARRVVENAFGIMANKFRILLSAINLNPQKVEKIVLACTALHNFLRREHQSFYTPAGSLDKENVVDGVVTPGAWHDDDRQLLPLERLQRHPTNEAKEVRKEFMEYFNEEGAVPWQQRMCGIC